MNDAHLEFLTSFPSVLWFLEVDIDGRLFLATSSVDLKISFFLQQVFYPYLQNGSYCYTLFMALLHAVKEAFYMQSTFFFFYFLKAIKANIRQIQFHLELKRKERFLTVKWWNTANLKCFHFSRETKLRWSFNFAGCCFFCWSSHVAHSSMVVVVLERWKFAQLSWATYRFTASGPLRTIWVTITLFSGW